MEVTWDNLDWVALNRIREGFLTGAAAEGPCWKSLNDLAHYDFTYAERIGWKWDHVLRELKQRGWRPAPGTLLDWGCGSGVAHRRVIEQWSEEFNSLQVFDQSTLAETFAVERAQTLDFDLSAQSWDRSNPISTIVISHVLNELDEDSTGDLMNGMLPADTVLWVELGTSDVAGQMVQWRDRLKEHFNFVYPCPHQGACGMLKLGNERHWCHHFAAPPAGVFADSNWVKFEKRAGIDLRSLPYAALVMDKKSRPARVDSNAGNGRIIGRPKVSKPFTRFLGCDEAEVAMKELPKRSAPKLAKKLNHPTAPRFLNWQQQNGKITAIDSGGD